MLADITFQALAPGVTPLSFFDVFVNLSGQGFTTENGQITVNSSVPEPMSLTLLASGLALVARRRVVGRGKGKRQKAKAESKGHRAKGKNRTETLESQRCKPRPALGS